MASLRTVYNQSWFSEAVLGPLGRALGGAGRLGELVGPNGAGPRIRVVWPWSKEIDDGQVLEAAPKKRTSHQKKRQRQLAGNNQQHPLRNLNRCPACGHYKRAHTLCMHCVHEIQRAWRLRDAQNSEQPQEYDDSRLGEEDKALNYPERLTRPTEYKRKLADTKKYVLRYPKTLVVPETEKKHREVPLVQRKPYR